MMWVAGWQGGRHVELKRVPMYGRDPLCRAPAGGICIAHVRTRASSHRHKAGHGAAMVLMNAGVISMSLLGEVIYRYEGKNDGRP